ncbi:hypothetical protein CLAIMM_13019 [Cladophialophora immunda]|nr:hypothetical protein CLAIMM_13019 [Cladophialophora immunda]
MNMDENILQNLAAQRSQECQLIDLTLGRLKKLHESEVAILGDLYREDRWRWTPEHGLQVGLPQDLEVRWFSRESVLDLQNRVRPLTLPDGEPDPNADRRLERQEYVWLLSQMLHYELGFALTPIDATARIATALRAGNVRQPRKLKHRAQKLRGDYRLRNSDLDSESAVNEETSTSGFDAQPEREQQLENGGTENGTGTTLSSAESDLKRRLVVGKARADTEAIIPGPMERDVGTGARAVQVRGEELQCNSNANEQYRVAAKVRVGRHTPDVCTSKTRPTRQSEDNSDPLERIPFGYIRSTESKSRHGDPPEAGAAANGFPPKIRRAPSPWNRNLSNRIQVSSLQQENLKLVQKATVNLYSPQSAKTVSLKKAEVPKKAESPKRTQIPGTALTVSDNYALNAKVEEVCKDTDKVVEELRHSSQTVVRSFKPPRKNKRPHSAAFSEHGGSRKGGKRKPNSTNTTYDLVERTTPGAPKSAIPRDNDVPIFPRMEYLMGCDRNGVPAKRAPFRRPTPLTHTLRDQSDAARIQERKRAIGADSPNHLLRGVG